MDTEEELSFYHDGKDNFKIESAIKSAEKLSLRKTKDVQNDYKSAGEEIQSSHSLDDYVDVSFKREREIFSDSENEFEDINNKKENNLIPKTVKNPLILKVKYNILESLK